MRKTLIDLVETVRGLRLSFSAKGEDRRVKLGIDPTALPSHLLAIHDALQAFDADGGVAFDDAEESGRLRKALDATFRWIRVQGLSTDEPLDLVAEALGSKKERRKAAYDILPAFAPQHVRKKKGWKPRLQLPADQFHVMRSIDDHRKFAADAQQVLMRIGDVAPIDEYPEPASPMMAR